MAKEYSQPTFQQYAEQKYGVMIPLSYLYLISSNSDADYDLLAFDFKNGSKSDFEKHMKLMDSKFKNRTKKLFDVIINDFYKYNKKVVPVDPNKLLADLCRKDSNFKTFYIENVLAGPNAPIIITIKPTNGKAGDPETEKQIKDEMNSKLADFICKEIEDVFYDTYLHKVIVKPGNKKFDTLRFQNWDSTYVTFFGLNATLTFK